MFYAKSCAQSWPALSRQMLDCVQYILPFVLETNTSVHGRPSGLLETKVPCSMGGIACWLVEIFGQHAVNKL